MFSRHRVRATFYHVVAFVFVTVLWCNFIDLIDDKLAFMLGFLLFAVDYVAEMYDPNPENPGPWFQAHFHRAMGEDDATE